MVKLTPSDLSEMFDRLAARVVEVVDGIRAGRIDVDPREGACDYCDYRDLCRVEQWRLAEDRR